MSYYLTRLTPFDLWRVVTEPPAEGEVIALPGVHWWSEAQAEADRMNGKRVDGEQGALDL